MYERKLIVLFAAFLLSFSCCSKQRPVEDGTLSVALTGSPTNIDPRYATDAYSQQLIELCYNGIMKKDKRGKAVPDLARSIKVISAQHMEIELKKGVLFHDGSELTSDDVIYTYSFLKNPAMGSPHRKTFSIIDRMEKRGPYSVSLYLKKPFAPFMTALTVPIVRNGTPGTSLKNSENGTGPFKMISFSPDESSSFVPFKGYFESPARVNIRLKVIPDDNVRFLELKKGEVNFLINGVDPDLLGEVRKDRNLIIEETLGSNFSYLGFNLNDPILKKKAVREAIAMGINRKEIIEKILGGNAVTGESLIAPMFWAHEEGVRKLRYNPDKARKLLDEGGYIDPDGPGPDTRFTVTYKTSQNELRRRIAQVIQEQLRKLGIKVEIISYEWGTFFSDIKSGNFQLYSLTWVGITDPDIYYYAFHSASRPPDGANRNNYENPEVDRLLEEGRVELDLAKRKKIYSRVQKIIAEDLPFAGLWYNKNILVRDRRIKGFTLYPDESFRPLKDVWITN